VFVTDTHSILDAQFNEGLLVVRFPRFVGIYDPATLERYQVLRIFGNSRAVYTCMIATKNNLVVGTSSGLTIWDFASVDPPTEESFEQVTKKPKLKIDWL
jgi:hypothetical protein